MILAVALLLAAGPADALFAAARVGDVAAARAALDAGADVNAATEYGATALHFAADKGHLPVVALLVERKADVNKKDTFYTASPLLWASMRGHAPVVGALLKAGATGGGGVLLTAARGGDVAMVKAVLDNGKPSPGDLTAARKAADKPELIALLEAAGAKPPEPKKPDPKGDAKTEPKKPSDPPAKLSDEPDPVPDVKTPGNWPQFRGAGATGVADGQFPPTHFDVPAGKNVRWKTPVPGLGHSCPVVWGDRVFVTTAVGDPKATLRPGQYGDVDSVPESQEHAWHVLAFDRHTGKPVWDVTACRGVPKNKRHLKGTHANPTPATDGTHLVVSFGAEGLYCYDLAGKLLWKKDLGNLDSGWFYDPDYQWGFGSSPVIARGKVYVQCDAGKGSFLAAYDVATGAEAWKVERAEPPTWGTPTVIDGPDRAELVATGTKFARGYDPDTGKELWRVGRLSEISVPTPFLGRGLIFVTSGYRPVQPIFAVKPGASGDLTPPADGKASPHLAWTAKSGGPYLPTPLVYGDHLYVLSNAGLLACYEAVTGKKLYSERVGGAGGYTGSLVAADGRIYCTSETGGVRVVRAGPAFELLAVNPVGETCLTTPAIADGALFLRTERHLLALGVPPVKR